MNIIYQLPQSRTIYLYCDFEGVILDQFYSLFVSMTLFHRHPHVKQAFDSTVNSTHCYMVLQDATCSHDIWKSYLRRRVNILVL